MKTPGKRTAAKRKKLDFRKVEMDLAEALSISESDLLPGDWQAADRDQRIFFDILQHADCALDWVLPAFWKIERKMQADDAEGALADALSSIVRLSKLVNVLGMAIPACRKRIKHSMKATENGLPKARAKKAQKDDNRRKEITDAVKVRMEANRKDSLHYARQYVATQLGISFDAVKRATAAMKPRKKMKK